MAVKNMVVSPVQLGRISIGHTVEKNGKQIPQKSDSIRVTGNAMVNKEWVDHPIMAGLKGADGKVRAVPVRVLFDNLDANLSTTYSCFDTKGRQVCVGDGDSAKRRTDKMEAVACPGPEFCEFGKAYRCKLYSRLTVAIDGPGYEENPTAGFVFRSTGWNSAKALAAQLAVFGAATGGKLAGFPAVLKIRGKSSSASMKSMFFYLDLVPQGGLVEAVKTTLDRRADLDSKIDWSAIEKVVQVGLEASPFSEDGEDGQAIIQEFYNNNNIDEETGEIQAEMPLSDEDVDKIKTGLQAAGRDIASLNAWLGREESEPLELMGKENFEKVSLALKIS